MQRDGLHTVQIPVHQIPGTHAQAPNLNRPAKFHNMHISVGDGDIPGKKVKSGSRCRGKIAHCPVSHSAHTTQGLKDIHMHLAHQRTQPRNAGRVLHHHHPWGGHGLNILPQIRAVVVGRTGERRSGAADHDRCGIAHHRLQLRKQAMDRPMRESFIAQAHVKCLDGIGQRAGVQPAQGVQFFRWQWRHWVRFAHKKKFILATEHR